MVSSPVNSCTGTSCSPSLASKLITRTTTPWITDAGRPELERRDQDCNHLRKHEQPGASVETNPRSGFIGVKALPNGRFRADIGQ